MRPPIPEQMPPLGPQQLSAPGVAYDPAAAACAPPGGRGRQAAIAEAVENGVDAAGYATVGARFHRHGDQRRPFRL